MSPAMNKLLFAECEFELLGKVEHESIQQLSFYHRRTWTVNIGFIVKDFVASHGVAFWSAKLPTSLSMHGMVYFTHLGCQLQKQPNIISLVDVSPSMNAHQNESMHVECSIYALLLLAGLFDYLKEHASTKFSNFKIKNLGNFQVVYGKFLKSKKAK